MPSESRLFLRIRLEDAVALVFFLVYIILAVFFRELRHQPASSINILIVIPAVCLLLGKEITHNFISGKTAGVESGENLGEFIRPYWEIIRDWLPFFILLLMYFTLWGNATHMMITRDRDPELIAWDQRLFGFQASVALQRIVSPPLTAWMELAYIFHLLNIPIVACFIYICRPRERFREMMCGVLTVTAFGLMGYLLVPGIGPMYALRDQFTVPLTQSLGVLNQQAQFIDYARVQRDVFPSLHVGISFVVWLYAYRNSRRLFWILSPFILSLWFSTVYLRYHYLVDDIAGFILAPLSFWLANWMFKRFGIIKLPVILPAIWVERIRRFRAPPKVETETIGKGGEDHP